MSMTLYPGPPHADGSCMIAFDGPPDVVVTWTITAGPGHVDPQSATTDASGRAWAIYYPDGGTGAATIEVTHGT